MNVDVNQSHSRSRWRGRGWLALALAVLLVGVGALVGVRWRRQPLAEPPSPPGTLEPVVASSLEKSRQEIRQAPRSAEAWGRLGMKYLAHHFFAEAALCLERAEQLDPQEVRWPYLYALATRRNDPDSAIRKLRRAVELQEDPYDTRRLLLAELLLQRGHLEEAAAHFRRILDREPDNGRAHLGLGQIALENEALPECLTHARRAAADARTARAGHIFLAEIQQRLGQRGEAEKILQRSQQLPDDPNWPDPLAQEVVALQTGSFAQMVRAAEMLQHDQTQEALELLRPMLRDHADSALGWLLLAKVLLREHEKQPVPQLLDEAKQALRRSLACEPNAAETHFYTGVVHFLQKNPRAAEACFRQAVELKPNYALAHYNLAQCLSEEGQIAEAITACRAALHCQPNLSEAHVCLGTLLVRKKRYAEARHHLQQALELQPDDAPARQLLQDVRKAMAQAVQQP